MLVSLICACAPGQLASFEFEYLFIVVALVHSIMKHIGRVSTATSAAGASSRVAPSAERPPRSGCRPSSGSVPAARAAASASVPFGESSILSGRLHRDRMDPDDA